MKTSILIIVTLLLFAVASQSNGQNSYNDVAVIINTNSTLSDSIGKYFIGARNIPASNVIYISAPVTEEIDSLQFENLRNQVEQHLITNNLVESINYLVTTKGVPLKVFRGNTFSTSSGSSSVESELCLILGAICFVHRSSRQIDFSVLAGKRRFYKKTIRLLPCDTP